MTFEPEDLELLREVLTQHRVDCARAAAMPLGDVSRAYAARRARCERLLETFAGKEDGPTYVVVPTRRRTESES